MLGTFEARKWFSFGTALSLYSGLPVNVTTGNDDYMIPLVMFSVLPKLYRA